jgi:DNA gyrase subunit A
MYIDKQIEDIVETNSMDYAQYVIKNRALPDLYSGMKPIHLKISWSMFENKTFDFTKSSNVSGKVTEYSPHGDCYDTIVNMVQKDRHIYNLIEGQGNWGSSCSTEMQYGASRYTECKMSLLGIDCMQGISKNMVEMINNFDNKKKMPRYLPTRFPLILCMAGSGIAYGMANTSPSYNLEDVCNASISHLNNEEIPMLIPDFATGGYVLKNTKEIERVNLTGRGNITLRTKYKIQDNVITVSEIPYGVKVNIESIIDKIIEKRKKGDLKEVADVLNQTGINGFSLEIVCKKGTNMNKLINKLFSLTPLESNFSANMNVLVEGRPMVLGVHDTIKEWTKFRRKCVFNGLNFDIDKLEKELHFLKGLKKVLVDIDKAVEIIRRSDNIENELMEFFNIDSNQANSIINIKLGNINEKYVIKQISEIDAVELKLNDLKTIVENPSEIDKLIIEDLKDVIKKFRQPRRTEIMEITEDTIQEITKSDLVEDNLVTICLTKEGYIKRNLKYSEAQKMKDDDEILQLHQTNNKSDLLLITNQGRTFIRKTYEIAEKLPSAIGEYLPNILDLLPNEKVIYICTTNDWTEDLICTFQNGHISKMSLLNRKPLQNRQVAIKNIFNTDSPLMGIIATKQDIDVLMVTQSGHGLIVNTKSINSVKSVDGKGVGGIKLDIKNMEDDKVVGAIMNVNIDHSITMKTAKGKELYIVLNDISPNKNESLYKYISKSRDSLGNFIYNTRGKNNDKVIDIQINK